MGPRSMLLQEGEEHLRRRKLMLPAFHGERMRAYEEVIEELGRGARSRAGRWAGVPAPPAHAGADPGGDPARRLRGRRGRAPQRLRELLGRVLNKTASPRMQLVGLCTRRFGGLGPCRSFEKLLERIDGLLSAEIAERARGPDLDEPRGHPLDAGLGALRGRRRRCPTASCATS